MVEKIEKEIEKAVSKCEKLLMINTFQFSTLEREREYLLSIPKEIMYAKNKLQIVIERIQNKKNVFVYEEIKKKAKINPKFENKLTLEVFKYFKQYKVYKREKYGYKKVAVVRVYEKIIHSVIHDDIAFQDIFDIEI